MTLTYTIPNNSTRATNKRILKKSRDFASLASYFKTTQSASFVTGNPVFTNYTVTAGDTVVLDLNYEEEADNIVPTNIPLRIIYEDDALLILDKPARSSRASFFALLWK